MEIYLSSNLKLLRKRKSRTQDDVAFSLQIKRSTYAGIESGNSKSDIETLIKLSDYFKVAIDTLLRVDLQSLSEFQLSELERGNDVFVRGSGLRVLATTVSDQNLDNIELVNHKAKAGYTTGFADPEYISELPKFQLPFLSKNKKYRTFQITGDSMLPIPDGALVTGEFVQDWNTLQSGRPYIIFTLDDGIVFKILDNLIHDEAKIRLYSLNPMYEPYDVHVQDIKEVWKFVHFISSDIPDTGQTGHSITQTMIEMRNEIENIKKHLKTNKRHVQ